jgi:hypothetical protein
MAELVFEVVQESDGGYCAECLTESIFTEGDTWDELRKNVLEATSAFFFDRPRPAASDHLIRRESVSALAAAPDPVPERGDVPFRLDAQCFGELDPFTLYG